MTTQAALRATKTLLTDHTFLFQGAGEAAIGIANLIVMALEKSYEIPRLVKNFSGTFNYETPPKKSI